MGVPESSTDPQAAPDWAAISHEVKCPLCGYNLRGLVEPTCPECGYHFEWDRVLHVGKYVHLFLFEHHPKRNLRSFFRTQFRFFRKPPFWKTIDPAHAVKVPRLLVYWAIGAVAMFLPIAAGIIYAAVSDHLQIYYRGWGQVSLGSLLAHYASRSIVRDTAPLCITVAVYPLLTFVSLLIFQQSMRRAKVRAVHVLRCAIYSGDVIFWFGLYVTAVIMWGMSEDWMGVQFFPWLAIGLLVVYVIQFARLQTAYRQYLRFSQVFWTIAASQVILALLIFTIFTELYSYRIWRLR